MNLLNANQLTPAETERLAILAEEMAEVSQIIGKVLRHGYESCHPDNPDLNNRELLEKELGHVNYALVQMSLSDDVSPERIIHWSQKKATSIQPYLHHQAQTLTIHPTRQEAV